MSASTTAQPTRQRAPSKRALATKKRVLDAAEVVFAKHGFDGATIRDIATQAGEPVGTIHHHGGGKDHLFERVVARRAETLATARLEALSQSKSKDLLTVATVLTAFFEPFFRLSDQDSGWFNYARLVAFVSTDPRWRALTQAHFDPTARIFLEELQSLIPEAKRTDLAEGLVFCVSALLAQLTTRDRVDEMAGTSDVQPDLLGPLVRFCASGLLSYRSP